MLQKVKTAKLSDQVFEQLRDHILNGTYKPDERLPSERELCEQLGVNRSSVREAQKRLEQIGLIEIRQGSGCMVMDFHSGAEFGILREMIVPGGKINTLAVRNILEFRSIFFPGFAKLAAQRITEQELSRFEKLVDLIEACAADDLDEMQKLDLAFHAAVAGATDNLSLELLFNSYRNMYFKIYDDVTPIFGIMLERRAAYRLILEAMRARDPELCSRLYSELTEKSNSIYMEHHLKKKAENKDSTSEDK